MAFELHFCEVFLDIINIVVIDLVEVWCDQDLDRLVI